VVGETIVADAGRLGIGRSPERLRGVCNDREVDRLRSALESVRQRPDT
jgi:hypothetical protein